MSVEASEASLTAKKALVADFFDRVWCQKDLDYHHELLAPEFRLTALWQNTSLGGNGQADRDESLGVITRWIRGFPDLRVSIEEQVSDGDYVASRHRFWGTHANEFMGYEATDIPVVISGCTIMKIPGDHIVAAWSCWDAASFLAQIGALPEAPEPFLLDEADLDAWRRDDSVSSTDPTEATALVRRVYQELWSDGSLDTADELFAPDFVGHVPGTHPVSGPHGIRTVVEGWRSVLSGLEFRIHAQHAEQGAVATRFTAGGVHTGTFAGRAPTGVRVTMTGIAIAHVSAGQIVSDWCEFDLARALREIDAHRRGSGHAR